MKDKERDAQEALGNMDTYSVSIEIPIKSTMHITRSVRAVSGPDAIARAKQLYDIQPEETLLHDAINSPQNYNNTHKLDDTVERKYTARCMSTAKDAGAELSGPRSYSGRIHTKTSPISDDCTN